MPSSPHSTMNPLVTPGRVELDSMKQDMMAAFDNVIKDVEVKLSQSHADCPVLIDKAWICTELMEYLPQTTYVLKLGPLVMAFTELMAMDDPFDAFHPPDTVPLDTYDPKKPCYLFTMPRELRDTIYDFVISSGSLSILQTSKIVRGESTEFLYKRRVCHLIIDLGRNIRMFSLQKPIASLIQNIKIEICTLCKLEPQFRHYIKQIHKFSGSIPRQTCRVVLLFNFIDHFRVGRTRIIVFTPVFDLLMSYLRTLNGFSQLIVEAFSEGWRPYTYVLEKLRNDLASQLGPSTWHERDDHESDYLEFHPRAHAQTNPGALSPEV